MAALRILLVGDSETRPFCLCDRLNEWGGQCEFASCRADVVTLLRGQRFELVLSRMRLEDGNAFELIPLMQGRPISLFSYLPAKDGCWWLPLVQSGTECVSGPALPEPAFMQMLEGLVRRRTGLLRPVIYAAPGH
jgi:CheY-like chemotaxis protein